MNLHVTTTAPEQCACDVLAVGAYQGEVLAEAAALDRALGGLLAEVAAEERFTGKPRTHLMLHTHGRIAPRRVVLVGLGPRDQVTGESVRRAAAAAAAQTRGMRLRRLGLVLPRALAPDVGAQAAAEGVTLGCYRFTRYRRADEDDTGGEIEEVQVVVEDAARDAATRGIDRGRLFAGATCLARDLVNEPPNTLTPPALAASAREIAGREGLECTVLGPEEMRQKGMGALLGVGGGSSEPPRLIVMEYAGRAAGRTVALVGKGVTFDSGGLSLKTADGMETMKTDMAGGAAVIGAMSAVARLAPPIRVVGVVAAVENLPSGHSLKPGDILRAMNGKTIEVNNTDAEGRLILADALAYAVELGADEVIDLATLTGSCIVALGRTAAGLMGNDEALIERLQKAGEAAGERLWPLPLYEEFFEAMKSKIADMRNSGGRYGGAQKAATILREFVGGKPWAHLDIAGPAFVEHREGQNPYSPVGSGTGFGVRTLLTYLAGLS